MNEVIKRVQEAIHEACAGCDPRDGSCFQDAALAAIAAMREPTETMVDAAVRTFVRENGGIEHAPFKTWQAMIDEALKP